MVVSTDLRRITFVKECIKSMVIDQHTVYEQLRYV